MASLAIVGRVVLREIPAGVLVLIRVSGAALVLTLVHWILGLPRVRNRSDLGRLAVLGVLGVSINQSFFLWGLRHTTAVNATILVTTIPVFTVLESVLTRREPPSVPKFAGIGLAGLGAIYLIGPHRISLDPAGAFGNALIVCGMPAYSAYLLLSKSVLERYPPVTVSTYVMVFGALGVIPPGLLDAHRMHWDQVSGLAWGLVAYIVLIPTITAYFLNIWALKRASSNLVAVYIYLQPIFTAAVAPAVLAGEALTARATLAGLAIFAGLGLVIWAEALQRREVPVESMVGE